MAGIELETDEEKYRAPALSKGLDIIELLSSEVDGLSLADIGKTLGRTTSEIFRMLSVLRVRGYIELADNDRYYMTTKLFEVAHRYPPIRHLTAIAGQAIQKLADRINLSVHLCILSSAQLLVVARADGPASFLSTVRLGAQIPIYDAASGLVLAAFMDDASLQHLLALAGEEPRERRARFLEDLQAVRERGYCERVSPFIEGVIDLSGPVFDHTGKVIAAVTTPYIHRFKDSPEVDVALARAALIETCSDLSTRMGAGTLVPSGQS